MKKTALGSVVAAATFIAAMLTTALFETCVVETAGATR
jgi:hypothetical protein